MVFKAKELKVVVKGEELLNGKTFASTHPDDSTWCLVENGSELQVTLALLYCGITEYLQWHHLRWHHSLWHHAQ